MAPYTGGRSGGPDGSYTTINSFCGSNVAPDMPKSVYGGLMERLDEEYRRMREKEQERLLQKERDRYLYQSHYGMQFLTYNDLSGCIGVDMGCPTHPILAQKSVKNELPPYKIQIIKYRIKYLLLRHPHLESVYNTHDIAGMATEETYEFLKSRI